MDVTNLSASDTIFLRFIKAYECFTVQSIVMLVNSLAFRSLPLGAPMLTDESYGFLIVSVHYKVNMMFFVEVFYTLFD